MDYDSLIKHHFGNLSRQVGRDVGKRYNYIINEDDLKNAYIQMRNELGYPLMIDSKYRRAIVYNKQGIEKKIEDMINECIMSNINELEDMIANDIVNDIANQLNGIIQAANGSIVLGSGTNKSGGNSKSRFVSSMARGLVKGVGNIVEDIVNPKDSRYR